MQHKFVFVVCGAKVYLDTLHFALPYLRHFSDKEILVVTDSSRNEIPIQWEQIIDIKTPEHLNHHQASIYLKTGLHKFVDLEHTMYCYLDTDVIAVREGVDDIFKMRIGPVTFCTDHCKMPRFSPFAVYLNKKGMDINKASKMIQKTLEEWQNLQNTPERQKDGQFLIRRGAFLDATIGTIKQYPNPKWWEMALKLYAKGQSLVYGPRAKGQSVGNRLKFWLKYQIACLVIGLMKPIVRQFFQKNGSDWDFGHEAINGTQHPLNILPFMEHYGYSWNKTQKKWRDPEGDLLFESDINWEQFVDERGLRFNRSTQQWFIKKEKVVIEFESDLLRQLIRKKFEVEVKDANWQHWNGGVFLFDKESVDFMNTWHEYTLSIFEEPMWMDRDQGTLIATAWKHNAQDNPTLPIEMNFLADYFHPTMQYQGDLTFDLKPGLESIQPRLIHIYHHFGDENWAVWRDVAARNPQLIPDPQS